MKKLTIAILFTILLFGLCLLFCQPISTEPNYNQTNQTSQQNQPIISQSITTQYPEQFKSNLHSGKLFNDGYQLCMKPNHANVRDDLVILGKCTDKADELWNMNISGRIENIGTEKNLVPASGIYDIDDKPTLEKISPHFSFNQTESQTADFGDAPMQGLDYGHGIPSIGQNDYLSWYQLPSKSYPGTFYLINPAANNACLDAKNTQYGMTLVERVCHDRPTQRWSWKK